MFIWGVLAALNPCSGVSDCPEMLNLLPLTSSEECQSRGDSSDIPYCCFLIKNAFKGSRTGHRDWVNIADCGTSTAQSTVLGSTWGCALGREGNPKAPGERRSDQWDDDQRDDDQWDISGMAPGGTSLVTQ